MIIKFDTNEPCEKTYTFTNVVKLTVIGNTTTIGYHDKDGVYHEETNETPRNITFINIGEDAEKDQMVLTFVAKHYEKD
jgi:hypothetical protein